MKNTKKKIGLLLFLIILIVIGISAILLALISYSKKHEILFGGNENVCGYSIGIPETPYDSVEDAIKSSNDNRNKTATELFRVEDNNFVHVFMQGERRTENKKEKIVTIERYVISNDIYVTNGKYYYIGARVVIVGGTELIAEDFKKEDKKYTWSETFMADIFGSKYAYGENIMGKMNNRVFAWGVSDNSKIESVTVDGQKIDEVHTIDVDGKEYSLWIIYDLQTENKAANVVIEEN